MAHFDVDSSGSHEANFSTQSTPDTTPDSGFKKPRCQRSKIWGHFTIQENNPERANCNYCGADLGCKSASAGTSSLVNHMKSCKKVPSKMCGLQTELSYQASADGNSISSGGTWIYNEKEIREAFARMIVVDELPFIFSEKEGFRFFMSKACPRFVVPSRTTMYRDVIALYKAEKAKLRKYFIESRQTVCLTTDCWTSSKQQGYMVLTGHYITPEWKLEKKILSFVLVDGHKGEDIGKSLDKLLIEWGIEKVCTITVDNASSNDTCLNYMKSSLTNRGCTISKGVHLHMRCVAHIVNLVVQDGLKIMCHPINRIRNAIKYVRSSPPRMTLFKKCVVVSKVQSKGLLHIDVCTRWNSTYLMVNSAEKFERAFGQYALDDPNYKIELAKTGLDPTQRGAPTHGDWVYVREFKNFLQHFYDLTNKVSGTKYVTSNTFLEEIAAVHYLLGEWSDHVICGDDEIFKKMAAKMKDKYQKYWGDPEKMNKYIFFAAILDPRTKESHFFKDLIEDTYGSIKGNAILAATHKEFGLLFVEYKKLYGTPPTTSEITPPSETSQNSSESSLMRERYNKRMRLSSGDGSTNSKSELDKYLAEDTEEASPGFDVLSWWKCNAARFPVLSKLARDILAIPISTVASESAFSTSGRILDDFRSSLTPMTLQALICAQDWLRRKRINIEVDLAELTKLEEEFGGLEVDDDEIISVD